MPVLKAAVCIFWVQLLHNTVEHVIEILLGDVSDKGDMQRANAKSGSELRMDISEGQLVFPLSSSVRTPHAKLWVTCSASYAVAYVTFVSGEINYFL